MCYLFFKKIVSSQLQTNKPVTHVASSWIDAVNITRITFEIHCFLVTFQFLRVEHPEDGVNDHKTCRNDTRLYFCESHVQWSVLWLNDLTNLHIKPMGMNHFQVSLQRPAHSTPESLDNEHWHNVSVTNRYFLILLLLAQQLPVGQDLLIQDSRTPLNEWSVHRRDLYLTTHNTHDIHAPGGTQTRNLNRRAAADLRLRPRGQWDRQTATLPTEIRYGYLRNSERGNSLQGQVPLSPNVNNTVLRFGRFFHYPEIKTQSAVFNL